MELIPGKLVLLGSTWSRRPSPSETPVLLPSSPAQPQSSAGQSLGLTLPLGGRPRFLRGRLTGPCAAATEAVITTRSAGASDPSNLFPAFSKLLLRPELFSQTWSGDGPLSTQHPPGVQLGKGTSPVPHPVETHWFLRHPHPHCPWMCPETLGGWRRVVASLCLRFLVP